MSPPPQWATYILNTDLGIVDHAETRVVLDQVNYYVFENSKDGKLMSSQPTGTSCQEVAG
ncbi:hypothetical protein [Corynebacterium uterequi]|uniref:Uncharacterized protein n=1 Tax=Corynebacterium uterequi TaxID=1072256 RepID=A0A0G3HLC2_9CORY|nr:hypothetical protein [Corynebacterium uterequi]AKK11922.1 hypothetical protein CUTER_09770 [Corynebacterium uterequi]